MAGPTSVSSSQWCKATTLDLGGKQWKAAWMYPWGRHLKFTDVSVGAKILFSLAPCGLVPRKSQPLGKVCESRRGECSLNSRKLVEGWLPYSMQPCRQYRCALWSVVYKDKAVVIIHVSVTGLLVATLQSNRLNNARRNWSVCFFAVVNCQQSTYCWEEVISNSKVYISSAMPEVPDLM
jgi:hypothetical protein